MLYREVRGQGEDIVLLHGWGMNAAVWSPLLDILSRHFRVTVVELPGHGESHYTISSAVFDEWVEAVLRLVPAQAVWIGWSLGGQIAQRAAVLAPERIHKLVLVATTPKFIQGDDWPHALPVRILQQFSSELIGDPPKTLDRFLSLQVKGDDQARQALRLLRQDIALRPAPNATALEHGLELLLTVDLRDQLRQIQCPTLWLLGERDTLVPVTVGDELERLMPDAEILILNGAAHAPFLSHTEAALKTLRHFLDSKHE